MRRFQDGKKDKDSKLYSKIHTGFRTVKRFSQRCFLYLYPDINKSDKCREVFLRNQGNSLYWYKGLPNIKEGYLLASDECPREAVLFTHIDSDRKSNSYVGLCLWVHCMIPPSDWHILWESPCMAILPECVYPWRCQCQRLPMCPGVP